MVEEILLLSECMVEFGGLMNIIFFGDVVRDFGSLGFFEV